MQVQLAIFIFSIILPLTAFMFFRDYLNNPKSNRVIIFITCGIFLLGLLFFFLYEDAFFLSLINPFLSYLAFLILSYAFRKRFNRLPKDTALDWSSGLNNDRFFNILFILLGIIGPILISVYLIDSIVN